MKRSELKAIINECIQELNESSGTLASIKIGSVFSFSGEDASYKKISKNSYKLHKAGKKSHYKGQEDNEYNITGPKGKMSVTVLN